MCVRVRVVTIPLIASLLPSAEMTNLSQSVRGVSQFTAWRLYQPLQTDDQIPCEGCHNSARTVGRLDKLVWVESASILHEGCHNSQRGVSICRPMRVKTKFYRGGSEHKFSNTTHLARWRFLRPVEGKEQITQKCEKVSQIVLRRPC